MRVQRFDIKLQTEQEVMMPKGAWTISAIMMRAPALFASVPSGTIVESVARKVFIISTGEIVPPKTRFIGTIQQDRLIFHVFDGGEPKEPKE